MFLPDFKDGWTIMSLSSSKLPYFKDALRRRPCFRHFSWTTCLAVHVLGDFYGWQIIFAAAVHVFGIFHGRLVSLSTFLPDFKDERAVMPLPSSKMPYFKDALRRCPRFGRFLWMAVQFCRRRPCFRHYSWTTCVAIHVSGAFYGWLGYSESPEETGFGIEVVAEDPSAAEEEGQAFGGSF